MVDETACFDDCFFVGCHVCDGEGDFGQRISDEECFDFGHVAVEGCFDVGNKDVVTYVKVRVGFHLEGEHTPVHHVGTVPFCGIFFGDVGETT